MALSVILLLATAAILYALLGMNEVERESACMSFMSGVLRMDTVAGWKACHSVRPGSRE